MNALLSNSRKHVKCTVSNGEPRQIPFVEAKTANVDPTFEELVGPLIVAH